MLPDGGHGVRLGQGQRQGPYPAGRASKMVELGFAIIATGGTADYLAAQGLAGRAGQQGGAGAAAHRRPDRRRRGATGVQHHRGLAVVEGQPGDPRGGAEGQGALFHHRGGEPGRGAARSGRCAGTQLEVRSLQSYYSASEQRIFTTIRRHVRAPPVGGAGRGFEQGDDDDGERQGADAGRRPPAADEEESSGSSSSGPRSSTRSRKRAPTATFPKMPNIMPPRSARARSRRCSPTSRTG